jgi:hypothetical protein
MKWWQPAKKGGVDMGNRLTFVDRQLTDLTEATLEMEQRLADGEYSVDDQQFAVVFFPFMLFRFNQLSGWSEARKELEKWGPGGKKPRAPGSPKKRTTKLTLVVRNDEPLDAA